MEINGTNLTKLNGPEIQPKSGKVDSIVLFLHGYGADGNDLVSIGHEWQEDLPNTLFIAPNAPQVCDMNPSGYQWFAIRYANFDGIEAGIQSAQPIINLFIDNLLEKYNLPENKLAVVGFSQGTMLALYTFLRRKETCAGIIGYSGALVGIDNLKPNDQKPPIMLVHGDSDQVVPVQASVKAFEELKGKGFDVEFMQRPNLGHGIDEFGLNRGKQFLSNILSN